MKNKKVYVVVILVMSLILLSQYGFTNNTLFLQNNLTDTRIQNNNIVYLLEKSDYADQQNINKLIVDDTNNLFLVANSDNVGKAVTKVKIIIQDNKGKNIKNAKMELYQGNSAHPLEEWTMDQDIKFVTLQPGTYTLKEKEAPDGYHKANDVLFQIDKDGTILINNKKVEQIVIKNRLNKYPYVVNYLEKGTNEAIHEIKIVNNVEYNTVIDLTKEIINIDNYKYYSCDKNELVITSDTNTINLYYVKENYDENEIKKNETKPIESESKDETEKKTEKKKDTNLFLLLFFITFIFIIILEVFLNFLRKKKKKKVLIPDE